ncbi:MAG: methylated-DNA--[Lachnospiraceae bacterium]|nr:methylated-DNA--[protein]-cysteine S-methyltransferase [Lachnospiraceae bacterium]
MEYIHHYNSPLGRMTMASAGSGLTGLWFDGQKYFGSTIGQGGVSGDLPVFDETERWLDLYFSGQAPDFTPQLSVFAQSAGSGAAPAHRQPALTAFDTPLAGWATPFRQAVWKILMTVPYGETISYGQIAGSRTGYAGGLERKAKLLEMERAEFI